jgi:DNA-directed RNA polymerase subunit RPC12/RpoP
MFLVPAALFVVMIPLALIDGDRDAAFGGILLAVLLGVPGIVKLRSALIQERDNAIQEQMIGFVRTHDSFSINELAAHLGKTPGDAQMLLNRDIARYHLPLVWHRASGRYLRLDRLSTTAQVAEKCQSCGAALGSEIVFAGEQLTCPYCASVVQTHAPAQQNWQVQGPWGHT